MHSIVSIKIKEVTALCEKYRVKRLDVFGSIANSSFKEEKSDIDFIVQFQSLEPAEHSRCYFGLLEELQDLFMRDIDLIESVALQNPYFIKSIERGRDTIYAG